MSIDVRNGRFEVSLSGASVQHDAARSYSAEIRVLLDRVWAVIRSRSLAHKGVNWVLYDADCSVFAGVELDLAEPGAVGLESRTVRFNRYAVWKHIGPYDRLADAYACMKQALTARGLTAGHPFIEKYGHWTDDPSKLETDLICPIA